MMDERAMYIVLAVLVALLIVKEVAGLLLARKSVDTSGNQYPSNTLVEFQKMLETVQKGAMELAYGIAMKTTIPHDEQGLALYAGLQGLKFVKQEDGSYLLTPISAAESAAPPVKAVG